MQIKQVPASEGIAWLRRGWQVLARQPLAMTSMTVLYLLLRYAPIFLVPVAGLALAALLTPFAVVGMMVVCRASAAGQAPAPSAFLTGFRDLAARPRLVRLGLIHLVLSLAIALLLAAATPQAAEDAPDLQQYVQAIPLWLLAGAFAAELLVLMLMWFAPLFAAWHEVPAVKSIFFSFFAVLRNKGAFLAFGVLTLLLTTVTIQVVAVLISLLPSRDLAAILIAPAALLVVAWLQAAAYASYVSVVASPPSSPTIQAD